MEKILFHLVMGKHETYGDSEFVRVFMQPCIGTEMTHCRSVQTVSSSARTCTFFQILPFASTDVVAQMDGPVVEYVWSV